MSIRSVWLACWGMALLACAGSRQAKPASEPKPVARSERPAEPKAEAAPAKPPPLTASEMAALGEREAKGLTKHAIQANDGSWTASVDAVSPPTVTQEEGIDVVNVPLGGREAIHCGFQDDGLEPASAIASFLEDVAQRVTLKAVSPWNVIVANDRPAVYVRALYLSGTAVGELKLAFYAAQERPVFCVHDEIGYANTFLTVTSGFFGAIARPGLTVAEPEFLQISVARIGDLPVGYYMARVERGEGKRVLIQSASSMLPSSPSELHLTHGLATLTVDESGRLISASWGETVGEQIAVNVQLVREKGRTYKYVGMAKGEPVEGTFQSKSPAGLGTDASIARALARVSKARAFDVKDETYLPGVDPTQPTPVRYWRDKNDAKDAVRGLVGKGDVSGRLDENGVFVQMDVPLGGNATLSYTRAVLKGKP